MIAKGCPKCEQQVPVACKACPCGHSFFSARKTAKLIAAADVDLRRRTQRVRREKPNYYDSLEFEKQSKTRNSESANDDDYKRENGKSKRKKIRKEDDEDDEIINNLSQAKQAQCSVILDELNRKLQLVTWKPTF